MLFLMWSNNPGRDTGAPGTTVSSAPRASPAIPRAPDSIDDVDSLINKNHSLHKPKGPWEFSPCIQIASQYNYPKSSNIRCTKLVFYFFVSFPPFFRFDYYLFIYCVSICAYLHLFLFTEYLPFILLFLTFHFGKLLLFFYFLGLLYLASPLLFSYSVFLFITSSRRGAKKFYSSLFFFAPLCFWYEI